ncbi:MAG: hypothetical protein COV99_04145 [Bacteroidetes bacterium CG12_big_fil_rev_8_21_14_0_65_60_17]|nr:MAG: hypothetical protein COV99_04145 [Bacteroidetes bacterium CG12_big_fil_rev_8_21_14_0_65_60_17]
MRRSDFIRILVALTFIVTVSEVNVFAQVRYLTVDSNMKTAHVFVDGEWVGRISDGPFTVPDSAEELMVKPEHIDAWAIEPIRFDLTTGKSDGTLRAMFPYHYRVESMPPGADVFLVSPMGDEWLGETPLLHKSTVALQGELMVAQEGYTSVRITPGQDIWNHEVVTLDIADTHVARRIGIEETDRRRRWIDVTALSTAVVAGALAIHFRTKADNRFDRWQETQDPDLKDRIQRFDVYSGIAVGTMQAGIGVFAFRLVF